MPSGERDEETVDPIGIALGLALMTACGLGSGCLTVGVLWSLYPPARSGVWQMAGIAVSSIVLALIVWRVLARRLGRRAGDWFVLGYGIAWVLLAVVVTWGAAAEFLRAHAAQSLGLPSG